MSTITQRFMKALEADGLSKADIERVLKKKTLRKMIVSLIKNSGLVLPEHDTPQVKASREIMGKNLIGLNEVCLAYGIQPNEEQISALSTVPYSEEQLRAVCDTHVLVADVGTSLDKIKIQTQRKYKKEYTPLINGSKQRKSQWVLLQKEPQTGSVGVSVVKMRATIGEEQSMIEYATLFFVVLTVHLVRGEKLFPKVFVRTLPAVENMCLGRFNRAGLQSQQVWHGTRQANVGLAVQIKASKK